MSYYTRREFIKRALVTTAGLGLLEVGCSGQPAASGSASRRFQPEPAASSLAYLAAAHGPDPEKITRAALAPIGGMERFVKQGHDVIIKPNICVDYHTPEYAATTNPQVVAALVKLCLEAGAKRVRVMDTPLAGTSDSAYTISGIREAVQAAGGEMEAMAPAKFVQYKIPGGKDLTAWKFYREIFNTDVLINVPIAKHHSLARLSLGSKNLLGVVTDVNQIHRNLGVRIAELASLIRPTLTVVDAVRILVAHGPTGGSLNDVKRTDTVIASQDLIAADSYAATLFGLSGKDVPYIQAGADLGLGTLDLESIKIEEVSA